ncbi:MAG: non-canonical purine NTP pyrophosphatase [Treponemataceae bacterium]
MEIFLASGNAHKKHEMNCLFEGHKIITPKDIGIDFNPDETGNSFFENALIKAKALYEIIKKPVIADDSGICVDALDGRPGIFSARYTGRSKIFTDGHDLTQHEQNSLLIEDINLTLKEKHLDIGKLENRTCRYVCSLILYYGTNKFICVQETLEGFIIPDIKECKGESGFGYDPIVFLKNFNKTVAQLSEDEKNLISHRGKAAKTIAKAIETIF